MAEGDEQWLQDGAAEAADTSEVVGDEPDQPDEANEFALSHEAEELSEEVPGEQGPPAQKT